MSSSPSRAHRLTFVIVGYNTQSYLERCLVAVAAEASRDDRIIYVDNCSADRSVELVRARFPRVEIVENSTNAGFARAANQGIDRSDSRYVLIMNPDTILGPGYVSAAISAMGRSPRCAGVIGKIYKYDFGHDCETDIIDTVGLLAFRSRRVLDRGAAEQDVGQFERPSEVFGITGNCALFSADALADARISGEYFDEDFFMYKEDVDLCWRMQLLGWRFYYVPEAIAFHGRGTGVEDRSTLARTVRAHGNLNAFQAYHSYKNHRMMLLKNELAAMCFLDFPYIAAHELGSFSWLLISRPKTLLGLRDVYRHLPRMLAKRQAIMARRQRSAGELRHWFRGRKEATA